MIRMSRMCVGVGVGACVSLLVVGALGCAQNGIGNGGLGGGTGTGGTGTGGTTGTSGTTGSAGAGGDTGVTTACPVDPPANGARCAGDLHCSYGSQTCCGMTYASQVANCSNGKFSVGFLETPCQLGGCGGAGGAGGGGGAGGSTGIACPADPTPEGFSCFPDEVGGGHGCTYGSTICCGVTYPTLLVTCQSGDAIVHQAVENPCNTSDYVCPAGGNGGGTLRERRTLRPGGRGVARTLVCGGRRRGPEKVTDPNRPSASSFGPAVKQSLLASSPAPPEPNARAQRPSMTIGFGVRRPDD
jgi:hypothetical protein